MSEPAKKGDCQWPGCSGPATKHVQYNSQPLGVTGANERGVSSVSVIAHSDLCGPHLEEMRKIRQGVQEIERGQCSPECPSR